MPQGSKALSARSHQQQFSWGLQSLPQASRSHYCVHKGIQKKPNLDEECEALLEDKRCKFYNNAQKLYGMQTSSSLQASLHQSLHTCWHHF